MGLISRMTAIIKAKMSKLLDRAEDPRETLDYSYERQLELLQNVKRGIVEVVTAKRRLQLQESKLREGVNKLDTQARQALSIGREDLARAALERKQVLTLQLQGISAQIGDLEKEQEKLANAEARLSLKVETFRTRKETIKAQYTAAEAQVRIGEAVSGISEEMADVGLAIQRAEDKTATLQARAAAIDELTAVGMLEDLTSTSDALDRELQRVSVGQSVELELAAMRQQLAEPQAKQLQEGQESR